MPESTSARFVTILISGDCIQTTRWRGGSLILFVLVYICMKREREGGGGSDYVVVKFQIYSDDVVVVVNIFPQYSFTLWLRYVLVFVKQNL